MVRRVWAVAGALTLAVLLAFHALLLYTHAVDGRLFEPAVALRWSVSIPLLGLLIALRRVGVPLLRGRQALVVWVLVALLHVSAARPAALQALTSGSPEDAAIALFVVPAPVATAIAAVGLLLLGAIAGRALPVAAPGLRWLELDRPRRLSSRLVTPSLASRAPPCPVQ